MYDNSRYIDIVVKLEEGGRDLDLHLYSFFFFSYCFSCKIHHRRCILENHFALLKNQRTTPKSNPKIILKEKAAREAYEEENSEVEEVETTPTKDQIWSASIVERLDTQQISVNGLRGTPSKTYITRRKMTIKTKMLVNLLILLIVLLHIVILKLMKWLHFHLTKIIGYLILVQHHTWLLEKTVLKNLIKQ